MSLGGNEERKVYACGFNGFLQLPLQDQSLPNSRLVTSPIRCLYVPSFGSLADHVAVEWSRCVFRGKEQDVFSHGFSLGDANSKEVITSSADIETIHCFNGSVVAIPSSSSGLLIQKGRNKLERVKIEQNGHREVRVTQVDSDETRLFVVTGDKEVGVLKESEGAYLYKSLFTEHEVKSLSCGKEHVLLLTNVGEVFSFGSGSRGQLGHGIVEDRLDRPSVVEAIAAIPVNNISAGGWHSAAVSEYGDLYMWGWNESGQLGCPMREKSGWQVRTPTRNTHPGESDQPPMTSPVKQEVPDNVTAVTQGENKGVSRPVTFLVSPQLVDMAPPREILIQSVSCGSRHTAALTRDGHLYTWGYGRWGQLGLGSEWTLDRPKEVEGLMGVMEVYCQEWNTFIMTREAIT